MMRFAPRRTDYEAFAAEHGDGLIRLAYTVCGDRGRAEDAAQEALISVYRYWLRLHDPLAYARRTAINATRADWRRSQRTRRAHDAAALLAPAAAEQPQEQLLVTRALLDALRELPHGQRAILALRYGSQLSEAETAATLEISVGTVKSQTARGLARMRALLSSCESLTCEMEAI